MDTINNISSLVGTFRNMLDSFNTTSQIMEAFAQALEDKARSGEHKKGDVLFNGVRKCREITKELVVAGNLASRYK